MARKRIPQKVRKEISDYLAVLKSDGFKVSKVFLFGSFARGEQKRWSDIDLCIISSDFKRIKDYPLDYLWKKRVDLPQTTRVEPIGYSPQDFIDEDPLVWEVKQTGVRVV